MQVTISEAKANLVELLKAAEADEIVILKRHGKQVARIVGIEAPASLLRIGALKGQIWVADDFDEPPAAFGDYTG